jgi:poly(3-hydroxybutyrate) depolymerase
LPSVADARVDRYACGGAEAVLWTIPGGTHVWPGAPGAPPAPDATRAIWRFFATIN